MSIVENAINRLSRDHDISDETDSRRKVEAGNGRCILSSGIEYSFVNLLCNQVFEQLPLNNRRKFHELFFIPNLRAEAIVGYDLSIGLYNQINRVRTMNKVINRQWCDKDWKFILKTQYKKRQPHEFAGDFDHFVRLLTSPGNIIPFLVLNICYCIHDYRRMGAQFDGCTIPPFDSLLRTVIIDLRALSCHLDEHRIDYNLNNFSMVIEKSIPLQNENEEVCDYISRMSQLDTFQITVNGIQLENNGLVVSFDNFLDQLTRHLAFNI